MVNNFKVMPRKATWSNLFQSDDIHVTSKSRNAFEKRRITGKLNLYGTNNLLCVF